MDDDKTQRIKELEQGTRVSHYTIVGRIGAGGMGEVYLAEDTDLNRKVALKFLSPILCLDAECRARFKREAQAAAKLNHPNIITIYEVGEFVGRPFFAMELVEGETLAGEVKDQPLSIPQIREIARQLCQGLAEAHDQGIIHRDIKPANIMKEKRGRYKILDFGLAKSMADSTSTQSKVLMGTVDYMSPEQVRGLPIDHRSDLYSLGVLLYELVTGEVPFAGADIASTLRLIDSATPKDITKYRPDAEPALVSIIERLLEKEREDRFQSAQEVERALAWPRTQTTVILTSRRRLFGILGRIRRRRTSLTLAALVALIAGIALFERFISSPDQTLLAILPLRNLGDADRDYFAEGLTAELLSRLSCSPLLGVISPSSTSAYAATTKDPRTIGKELGVDYLLQGTIRWDLSQTPALIRINVDLIRTDNAVIAWSSQHDAVLSQVLTLQAGLASELASALNLTLTQPAAAHATADRGNSAEAVDYLMRGDQYFQNLTPSGLEKAQEMYQRAIAADSQYALAHAKLGEVHARTFWYFYDRSPTRLNQAFHEISTALHLAPELPEAHSALGYYYYYAKREYDSALTEFRIASALQPGNGNMFLAIAFVQRRQAAWNECLVNFNRARKLNPRDPELLSEFAGTLIALREYRSADSLLALSLQLAPDMQLTYYYSFMLSLLESGDTNAAARVIATAERNNRSWWGIARYTVVLLFIENKFEDAEKLLDRFASEVRNEAIDLAEFYSARADLYRMWGRTDRMRANSDSLRMLMESELQKSPDEPWYHVMLGRAFAGLGDTVRAVQEAEMATVLLPTAKDAYDGPDLEFALAEINARTGRVNEAVSKLRDLLEVPSFTSVPLLRIWPDFTSLHGHPGFQRLLATGNSD